MVKYPKCYKEKVGVIMYGKSLVLKAVCIIDCHNKLVYMNDFYQNLFNEEKIGYKTKLGDAVINRDK